MEARYHLRMAFPNRPETFYSNILKRVYTHFGQVFVDALRIERVNTRRVVSVNNRSCLDNALAKGKGVVLVSGHLGNWEMIPVWFAQNGYELHVVVRKQKNKGADRFFLKLRQRIGTTPLYVKTPPRHLISILRKGGIVGLAIDQDARRRGIFVDFFGIPTSTSKGPAVFHLKTQSPIIMAVCSRNRNGTYQMKFDRIPTSVKDGDAVTAIIQRVTSHLENEIRKNPEQYFWYHRRWKTKPALSE